MTLRQQRELKMNFDSAQDEITQLKGSLEDLKVKNEKLEKDIALLKKQLSSAKGKNKSD